MNKFKTKIVGLATAVLLSAGALVAPITASAATIDELMAQIVALQAQLQALQGTASASTADKCSFTRSLTVGSKGSDVTCLQTYLQSTGHFTFSGGATGYFGSVTKTAVAAWQSANGVSPAVGYFGSISRAKYDSLMAGTAASSASSVASSAGSSSSVTATGTGLTIASATQPAATLAVQSAARLPFTKVTLTAGAQDVVVTGITVERTGLANDAVFSGVVLLDETGAQLGIAKTFNSDHKATVGDTVTIKAGASQTFTVAGNMASGLSSYAGQVAYLSVTGVNTSATVSGLLPISGAGHTINASLTIGSVTMAVSSYDPNSAQTKEIGTTGYKFAGVRVTAGSAEKLKLWSVRWNQSGSASKDDLANVKVYVDGTAYDTVISSDGKYYSAIFSGSILIDKGLSKDIYIQGDIIGSGSAGRTVRFDIYKTTDLYLSGETYGYGITPAAGSGTASDSSSEFTASTPWFDGSKVTVSAGSVTSIGKATSVAAANIAVNVPGQVLGGFTTDVKGEPISVQSMSFTIATSGVWTSSAGITGITLVDSNDATVAGPVDEASTCTSGCTITFTDTVTFPIGARTYTIKGKIPTGAPNGATVIVSATPSSGWTTVTGQTTGNTISLSGNGLFAMNTMTVKSAALTVTVGTTPAAQSIVSGGRVLFTNYQFDATQSGEDIRFGVIPLAYDQGNNDTAAAPSKMTSCQLYDGTTALNTGSNVLNPSSTSDATTTSPLATSITLDSQLTVPKGKIKTLSLECNVASSAHAASVMQWGLTNGVAMTVTGVTSGADVAENLVTADGSLMTIATGSFTASVDSSSPSFALAAAGSTGVNAGVFKFRATNEVVNLTKVGLILTSGTASDVNAVYLYNGATLLGTATFTGSNTTATSTLNSALTLPKDTDLLITLKADLRNVGSSEVGTQGQLVKIDVTNAEGSGASSGSTLQIGGVTAGVNGVRMFKSFPVVAQDSLSSTGISDGKLMRFKVTANSAGPVGLFNLDLTIATSSFVAGGGVSSVKVMVYSDSGYSSPVSGTYGASTGQFGDTNGTTGGTTLTSNPTLTFQATTNPLQIPANTTYYFQVESTVASTQTGTSVTTTLNGDVAYIAAAHLDIYQVSTTTGAIADGNNDFIWSGNATSTAVFNANDWANGYGVLGLPSGGFSQTRSN